jgi:protein-disulfide isomerase
MAFQRMWQLLDRMATVAMLIASFVVIWTVHASRAASPSRDTARTIAQDVDAQIAADVVSNAAIEGSPNAKIVLVEFSDYHCPYCGRHANTVEDELRKDFVSTGRVRHVFFNFPLETIHPQAAKVAEGAECARKQGKFWEMHDRLFVHQQNLTIETVHGLVRTMDLDQPQFLECFDNGRTMTRIQADLKIGRGLNVNSTPTFFIGIALPDGSVKLQKRFTGSVSFAIFEQILEDVIQAN